MIVVTAEQMRRIDRYAIEEIGIPSIVLMENAKNAMIKYISFGGYDEFTVFAGIGNNGGDGLAIARDLIIADKDVKVYIIGDIIKGSKDFLINYNILKNLECEIMLLDSVDSINKSLDGLTSDTLVIDALFGTGLQRNIEGKCKLLIDGINKSNAFKFSIDIPSGLNADTGEVNGIAIESDFTVTLGAMKKGLLGYKGEVMVENIGIPKIAFDKVIDKL